MVLSAPAPTPEAPTIPLASAQYWWVAPFPHRLEDVGGDPGQGQYSQAPTPRKEATFP